MTSMPFSTSPMAGQNTSQKKARPFICPNLVGKMALAIFSLNGRDWEWSYGCDLGVWSHGYKSSWPKDSFGTVGVILSKWHCNKSKVNLASRNRLQSLEMLGEPFWEPKPCFGFKIKIFSIGESFWELKNDLAISCKICDLMALESNPIIVICGCDLIAASL